MGLWRLKGRGRLELSHARTSQRLDLVRHEGADLRVVGDGQGPLEPLRLVGKIIPARDGDEFVGALCRRRPLPGDLEEVVPSEVDLFGPNRLELHVRVASSSVFVFHSESSMT